MWEILTGKNYCLSYTGKVCGFFCCYQWYQGNSCFDVPKAQERRRFGSKTIVFVDEIHRFNKAQQDAFLPFVEKGSIILIGATTENPSFEVNGALLSRCKVFVLKPLDPSDLFSMLKRALQDERGFAAQSIEISDEMLMMIANFANGDAPAALYQPWKWWFLMVK